MSSAPVAKPSRRGRAQNLDHGTVALGWGFAGLAICPVLIPSLAVFFGIRGHASTQGRVGIGLGLLIWGLVLWFVIL